MTELDLEDADRADGSTEKPAQLDELIDGTSANDMPASAARSHRRMRWLSVVGYGVVPTLVILLAGGAGYLKWQNEIARQSQLAAAQSVSAATEAATAMLSYQANTADKQLNAARERLTGRFRDEYSRLIKDVVIPGAKEKHISVTASSPAAAPVSASMNHAVVLVYVNQTTTMGGDPPTDTASAVLVTLDKEGDRWLVSSFDPV
ncbi:hypothetical protein FZI94_00515 [Mycobacterium sp. CBMA226]|nr:hypothetical protein [Mycolicibacterium sp. CBMA 226]